MRSGRSTTELYPQGCILDNESCDMAGQVSRRYLKPVQRDYAQVYGLGFPAVPYIVQKRVVQSNQWSCYEVCLS